MRLKKLWLVQALVFPYQPLMDTYSAFVLPRAPRGRYWPKQPREQGWCCPVKAFVWTPPYEQEDHIYWQDFGGNLWRNQPGIYWLVASNLTLWVWVFTSTMIIRLCTTTEWVKLKICMWLKWKGALLQDSEWSLFYLSYLWVSLYFFSHCFLHLIICLFFTHFTVYNSIPLHATYSILYDLTQRLQEWWSPKKRVAE